MIDFPMLIPDKQTFYDLAFRGYCGNTPTMWGSLEEYMADPATRPGSEDIGIRSTSNAHRWCVPRIWALDAQKKLDSLGVTTGGYIVSAIPRGDQTKWKTLQGELGFHPIAGEWVLTGALQGGYQRAILNDPNHMTHWAGFDALRVLRRHCDTPSYEGILELFDRYTVGCRYPVIEFAVFPEGAPHIGRLESWNTLIWEIRHY